MYHGAHTRFTAHIGLCLTDDDDAARCYATQGAAGELATVDVDMSALTVVEVEGYDRDENRAVGDDDEAVANADVIVFDDEDPSGWRQHRTWRLMSQRAVDAMTIESVVNMTEDDDDDDDEEEEE